MEESEAEVHERLGWFVVLVLIALEQNNGEVLHQLEERVLLHLLVGHFLVLKKNNSCYIFC